MKRSSLGNDRASRKKLRKRQLAVEALEPKRVLDATFGFISTPGGFAFEITGTDFVYNRGDSTGDNDTLSEPDNIVMWYDTGAGGSSAETKFFVEWVDDGGTWHSLGGGVSAGDIADEAQDRNLQAGDFEGFFVKARGGQDTVNLNGANSTYPGGSPSAPVAPATTPFSANGYAAIGIRTGAAITPTTIYQPFIGQRAQIEGMDGGDFLFGSPEDDFIDGGNDKDIIVGHAGNDILTGGNADDMIDGGSGADLINGDEGRDGILGGGGDDTIKGGGGDDGFRACGGHNDSRIWFPSNLQWSTSFTGQPIGLFGGSGNDEIDGGDGCDDISGGANSDGLMGGAGDDSLLGDSGDKTPSGGSGTDAWQKESGGDIKFAADDIEKVDTTGNDAGEPSVRWGDYKPDANVNRKYTTIKQTVAGPFGSAGPFVANDQIDLSKWVGDGTSGVQIITGGGNDILAGSDNGADILQAGGGNDTLIGGGKDDYLGGDANANGSSRTPDGFEASHSGQGAVLTDATGSDLISGGDGADIIDGFDPDNSVTGWTIDSQAGDTLTYDKVALEIAGGNQSFDGSPVGVLVSLEGYLDYWRTTGDRQNNDKVGDNGPDWGEYGHAEGDIILDKDGGGMAANDKLYSKNNSNYRASGDNSSIENVIGSDLADDGDELYLDVDSNGAQGKGGDDAIYGLEANDILDGGDGDDTLDGDYSETAVGKHIAVPADKNGNDNLNGGKGKDTLYGRKGFDQLRGEIGDDTLIGGSDVDAMSGGKGQDTLEFEFNPDYVIPTDVDYVPDSLLGFYLDGTRFAYTGGVGGGGVQTAQDGLVDLNWVRETETGIGDPLRFAGFVFGDEDGDDFDVTGADTASEQLQVRSELAFAESEGRSDFEVNEDDLDFI